MGAAQATEVLDVLHVAPRRRVVIPRLPSPRSLLMRELTVAEATIVLMTCFFVSALLGAIRQILFNSQFGAGPEANAFYAAFRLPDTLFSLIAGGALSSAMIPVLLTATRGGGAEAAWRLTCLVLTALLAAFSLVVVAGELFAPFFVGTLLAPGFDAETSRLTVVLTRIMLVQPLILILGSVATAVLSSRNRFVPTALAVLSHNVALIAGIVAARIFPQLGILGPTFGVIGGAVLQALILLPGLRGGYAAVRLMWDTHDVRLRAVVRLLIPNGLAIGVGYTGFIVDTAFASTAPEPAGLPALQNAWLLAGLPIALLGQAVGQSVFPRLASQVAAQDWRLLPTLVVASTHGSRRRNETRLPAVNTSNASATRSS